MNVTTAANGKSWDSLDKQLKYKSRASQPSKPHFYNFPDLGNLQQDRGGIISPKEGSLMIGDKLFRLVYVKPGISDKDLLGNVTSEWFGSPSVFIAAKEAAKFMTPSDCQTFDRNSTDEVFLDLLQFYQGLGFKYKLAESRIVEYKITKPLIALSGRGRTTTGNYESSGLSSIGLYQPSPQIFVPGYIDLEGRKDVDLMKESLEIRDFKDAISFLKNV